MMKSFSSLLLSFVLSLSMALTQFSPAYAASLPAEINQQFTPLQIDAGGVSVLRITIFNPNTFALTNVAFIDDLVGEQPGLFVASAGVNTCGGSVTFTRHVGDANDNIINLSGGNVPAQVTNPGECYVEVNVTSTTAGNLINTIQVGELTANGIDGVTPVTVTNTSPASATITVIAVEPPSMSKTFSPNTIYVGETSQLTIRINNNDADTNLTNVSFTDNLPAGVVLATPVASTMTGCGTVGVTLTAAAGGTSVALSGGTITPAIDCVIKVNVTGTSGVYTNIIPAGALDPNSLHTQQGVTNTTDVKADLNIQPVNIFKAFAPTSIDAGDAAVLTITLQNPTNAPYTGVGIIDNLPAGLTFTGTPTTTCTPGGVVTFPVIVPINTRVQLTGGTIPARPTPTTLGTCTITASVHADLTASGTLTNTIPANTLTATQPGVTNVNPVTADITVLAALTGTKSYAAPYAIGLGGTNTVTITLYNNSSTTFTDVDFSDALPSGLTISGTPASPQCGSGVITSAAASVTLTNGTIAANSSCTITFNITSSTPGSGPTYENTIGANTIAACTAALVCVGNGTNITTGTDLTVVNAPQLPVEVSKAFNPTATTGNISRLTITITAPLDIAINRINFTDTLPVGVTVAALPNAATTCPGGLAAFNLTNPALIVFNDTTSVTTLAAGVSCTIAVDVTTGPGIYINNIPVNAITTAQLRTNSLTAATANLSVTSMTMKKAFYPTTVQADGKSTLTITLENTSASALTNVHLTDLLPGTTTDGLIVDSLIDNTCGGVINPAVFPKTIELVGGTVPAQVAGIPGICTITVDVQGKDTSPSSSSSYTNTIPVSNVTATVGNSGPTIEPFSLATATLNIKNLKLGVVKGFNPVLVYGGATSTMTVQLINPNSVALTGVTFTDDMDLFYAPAQSGMQLANPPFFNTGTCGGTLTGDAIGLPAGDSEFTFSGGVLQPNSICTLTLRVVMNQNGSRTNKIPIGAVTTFNGVTSDQPTQASLTNLPGISVNKVFNPNPVMVGEVLKLTITITNTSNVPVVNMELFDNFPTLPIGLVIANTPYLATNTCTTTGAPAPLSAVAGSGVIHLTLGGLAGLGDPGGHDICTVEVNVVSSSVGAFVNIIAPGGVTADGGIKNNNPGTDTLKVGGLFSLGNRVWFDTNNNGLIDTLEVGVDNVVVQLYSDVASVPTLRGTQLTTQGGYYRFDDLEPGDYTVVIPEDNFRDVGALDVALTDPLAGYWSSGITIAATGTATDATNNDPDTTPTDSDENGLTQASGAVISNPITLGPLADEPTNDADMPLANPFGESPDAQSNRTVDFGFYRGSLGNLVFLDSNGNGTYGTPDLPIPGATVELFASNAAGTVTTKINVGPDGIWGTSDDALGDIITDADGNYLFDGLPQGDYVVKVTPPAGGYSSTVDSADTTTPNTNTNNNDNGVGLLSGQVSSNPVTLTPGAGQSNNTVNDLTGTTYNPTLDFGFLLYSLGNRVWYDTNNDGVLQGTEVGISGVRVELYRDTNTNGVYNVGDTFIGFNDTDASGYYRFDDLPAGEYVVVIPSTQFVAGAKLSGYWSTGMSMDGTGALIESATNDPDLDRDASNVVGTSDENGVTTFSSALITAANPINYVSSTAVTLGVGNTEPTGENNVSASGQGTTDNHANMTVDFGFYRAAIGDLVFIGGSAVDDGKYDVGVDNPLTGAVVKLFTTNGTQIPVGTDGILGTSDDGLTGVTTPATGLYSFGGLPAGDYVIKVTPPAGYSSMVDTANAADTTDPDTNTNNNDNGIGTLGGEVASGPLTMNPTGEVLSATITRTDATGTTTDTSVDFGFISPNYSLGNRVWFDTNNNGLIDIGTEQGVSGVRVELYQDTGTTVGAYDAGDTFVGFNNTSATGYYRFDNLAAGEYVVLIANDNFTAGANTSLVGYWSSGTTRADNGTISDSTSLIANDPDNDTDLDENGVTTFTGSTINYVSSAAVTLGDFEPTGETDISTLWQGTGDNRANMTVDFGFYRTAIGNLVFVDANNNGAYVNNVGAGEIPLAGATVQLFTGDGLTQIGSNVVTAAAGTYSFTGLPQGNYIVKVTPPVGYSGAIDSNPQNDNDDPDNNVNDNDNGIGLAVGIVPSPSGQLTMNPLTEVVSVTITKNNANGTTTDTSVDFGFVPLRYSLGNRVWYDTNNNSLLDGAEVGVSGVRVELYFDTNGNNTYNPGTDLPVAASPFVNTDANGYYRFDNLLAGNYVVVIPNDNFTTGGTTDALVGYRSNGTTIAANGTVTDATANDPDTTATDSDDNGLTTALAGGGVSYVASAAVTLGPDNSEPITDSDAPSPNPAGEAADNQSNRTVDFGFYRVEVGNLVFIDDVTKDGVYASGETLLANANVYLYSGNNLTQIQVGADGIWGTSDDGVATYVTGVSGTYAFSGLPEGDYIVRVTPPTGGAEYVSTLDTAAPLDTTDPDTNTDNNDNGIGENALQVSSGALTMTPGQGTGGSAGAANNVVTNSSGNTADPTVDFGFVVAKYYIGNRVWFDTNNSSAINFGTEQGVSGVRVELYFDTNGNNTYNPGTDLPVAASPFVNTDINGYYRFDNLDAGNYIVVIPNDNFTIGGTTDALVGYWSSGTIIDAGNVRSDNTANDPDTTATDSDENGLTSFTGGAVDYVASTAITLGATAEPIGETDLSATGQGTTYDNRANMTVDFGFYRVEIGNLIFVDADGSGAYNLGDTALSGATVQLFASNGTTEILVGQDGIPGTSDDGVSFVTDGTGLYLFKNLPAGDYIVKVTPPGGFISTVDTSAPTDTTDPDINTDNNDNGIGILPNQTSSGVLTMNPTTEVVSLSLTKDDTTGITTDTSVDFGFTKVYSLGNRVWFDTNNNSILDAGESGVNSVRVELYHDTNANGVYDAGDISAGFVNTDASGYYRFDNLAAGDYVALIPNDNFTSGGNVSLVDYWSSGTSINGSGATSDSTSIITDDPDNNVDSDDNGVTTFAANAINYVSSAAITLGAEAEPTLDDDPIATSQAGEAPDNRSNRTVDFGFYQAAIGNLVFVDVDKDGTNNTGDLLLTGATVQLFASNGSTQIGSDVTTGVTGIYSFTGLPAGDYIVKVTPPVGYVSTVDTSAPTDTTDPDTNTDNNDNGIDENAGQVNSGALTMNPTIEVASLSLTKNNSTGITTDTSVDFGFVTPLYSLGNRVWLDTNNNGVIDAAENGVSGVRVELFNTTGTEILVGPDGALGTADDAAGGMPTNANGYYRFDNLPAGDYVVRIPNDNFTTGGTTDALIGYWSTGTSVNASGGISEGATNDPDNNADASSNPATSDENGATTFSGNTINYVSSAAVTLGPDTSEPTGETAPNGQGTLDNRANMTVDFGFYSVGIGNLVFVDAEVFDGKYDSATDTLLPGATVDLYASDNATLIKSMTTLADGKYAFTGLPAGDYIVKASPPVGYASTVDTDDSVDTTEPDNNKDNNDNGGGTAIGQVTSGTLTMTPGGGTKPDTTPKTVTISAGITTDTSVDFGFNTLTFSLGNRVWYDTNNNGVLDTDESGISGVRVGVYLDAGTVPGSYDAGDTFVGFNNTNATGYYRFDNLPAGDYVVVIPNDNFTTGGNTSLVGYWSTGTTQADNGNVSESATSNPETNADSSIDENGATTFSGNTISYVSSGVITLGPATNEPTGETDFSATGQGTLDNRANMTLDFGFYTVEIGDLVFVDMNANGTYLASDDLKLSGATVQLFAGDGATSLGSVITGADGTYSFTGLPEGNYVVKVTPPNGYVSTVDLPTTLNPDNNTDNDDNGITESIPGLVTSGTLVMTAGEKGTSATGTTADPTVDFGFKAMYSLGNRVWFDTNNNSQFDSANEVGIIGVVVELYKADASGFPTGIAIDSKTTDASGYYRFDNLPPADYVVVIPADNFTTGGVTDALVGYWSSGTTRDSVGIVHELTAPKPEDSASDIDDNGTRQGSGAVISAVVTLGNQAEPTSDNDPVTNPLAGESPNNQSNRTVDFGFYRVEVSNQIFVDLDEDGTYDSLIDLPLPYATVKLFASNGTNQLDSVTTDATGTYLFTNLPEGDYIVKVTPPSGYSSTNDSAAPADTANPNANTDNNDNGIGTGTGEVSSNSINLNPNGITGDNGTGTTSYPTLDFGFTISLAKAVVATDAAHTTGNDVTIGEIITYEITILVPVGKLTNATVLDTPQTGLAFVDCIEINLPTGVTSKIDDGVCNTKDGTTVGTSNPLIENNGGRATFDFGDIINTSLTPQLVTIRYSLIVLDIASNHSPEIRTNHVTWSSNGGTKTVTAIPVEIVEPKITIDKNANPTTAQYGSTITFTIDVAHATQSTADAFDVVVTDQIPAGLELIPGSVNLSGTATPNVLPYTYDAVTNLLKVRWDVFHLGETGRITFQATFVGPAPIVNSASVEWTSLLIDPTTPPTPDQLSPYNPDSTERWYDPGTPTGVDNYQVLDSVTLRVPGRGDDGLGQWGAQLPATGFAPNTITELPLMPEGFSYARTDLWIEIPKLGLKMNIVGVPFDTDTKEWDLTWLASDAGWLENTAYPTHAGNSAITSHITLANGLPGPFAKLDTLSYGDQVIVHLEGQKYLYEVRDNKRVRPEDVNSTLKHEEYPWLTLMTCKTYNESTGKYTYRSVVRAVLIKITDE